jgi:hypothetical protein
MKVNGQLQAPPASPPVPTEYELSLTVVLHVIVCASVHDLDHSDPVLKRWVKVGIHTYRFNRGRGNSKLRIFINELSVKKKGLSFRCASIFQKY